MVNNKQHNKNQHSLKHPQDKVTSKGVAVSEIFSGTIQSTVVVNETPHADSQSYTD